MNRSTNRLTQTKLFGSFKNKSLILFAVTAAINSSFDKECCFIEATLVSPTIKLSSPSLFGSVITTHFYCTKRHLLTRVQRRVVQLCHKISDCIAGTDNFSEVLHSRTKLLNSVFMSSAIGESYFWPSVCQIPFVNNLPRMTYGTMRPKVSKTCKNVEKLCLCVRFIFWRKPLSFRSVNRPWPAIHSRPKTLGLSLFSIGVISLFPKVSSKLKYSFVRL